MISVAEHNRYTRIVFFDGSGTITKISSRTTDEDVGTQAIFELEDVKPFLTGEFRFSDYIVMKSSLALKFEIKKKTPALSHRSVVHQVSKIISCNDADIVLNYKDNIVSIMASDKLLANQSMEEVNSLVSNMRDHQFFVTFKDQPNFIIDTLAVPFSGLLVSGIKYEFKLSYPKDKISIYTKKYFNTYSLE